MHGMFLNVKSLFYSKWQPTKAHHCSACHFETVKKRDYDRHLNTKKCVSDTKKENSKSI
jgi:hypothetical protein